ncbi:MAG: hypothetical protein WCF20_14440 [Methylovirgula sp.]
MTKLTASVVAIALSVAATAAIAQTSPSPDNRLMATPSASDPAVRDSVMATVKAAPKPSQQSRNASGPSSPNKPSVTSAFAASAMRGTAPARP